MNAPPSNSKGSTSPPNKIGKWSDGFYDAFLTRLRAGIGGRYRVRMVLLDPKHGRADDISDVDKSTVILLYGDEYATDFPSEHVRRAAHVIKQYCPADWERRGIIPVTDRTMNWRPEVDGFQPKPCSERSRTVLFSGNLNHRRVDLFRGLAGSSFGFPFRCAACYPETGKMPFLPLVQARLMEKILRRFTDKRDFGELFPNSTIRFYDGFFHGQETTDDYLSALLETKIVWCPPGFVTNETSRLLEASQAGCVVVTGKLPDTTLYRGHPFVAINDWRMVRRLTDSLLNDESRLDEMGASSRAWYLSRFSPEAQANRVIETIERRERQ